jgi:hypothetical protein
VLAIHDGPGGCIAFSLPHHAEASRPTSTAVV